MRWGRLSWTVTLYCVPCVSCATIFGLDDLVVEDTRPSSGSGGVSGGAGGSAGKGGSAGAGGYNTGGHGGAHSCDQLASCYDCQACTFESGGPCRTWADACQGSSHCTALLNCVSTCGGDSACEQQCKDDHPAGLVIYKSFWDCMCGICVSTCQSTCS